MLDELDAIVNSGQSVVVLTILSDPNGVLVVSGGLFSGVESFVSFDVLDCLSQVGLSISKGFDGVISQLGVSSLLSNMVIDVGIQIEENLTE